MIREASSPCPQNATPATASYNPGLPKYIQNHKIIDIYARDLWRFEAVITSQGYAAGIVPRGPGRSIPQFQIKLKVKLLGFTNEAFLPYETYLNGTKVGGLSKKIPIISFPNH